MINPHDNYYEPSPGYKYLTNGETYTDGLYLGRSDDISHWHDTNDEPPEPEDEIDDSEALDIILGGDVE